MLHSSTMHLTLQTVLLALIPAALGVDLSTTSDLDGSIWENVSSRANSRVTTRWNRPAKRQSGWQPPSELATALKEVWDHCLGTYTDGLFGFKNFGWDQLMATEG